MGEEWIKPGYYPDFPVDRILQPEFSFRRNVDEGIGDLVEEIKAAGIVIEPIVCRPSPKLGYVELGPGERRLKAAKQLGMKTVPVIVKEMNDAEFDRIRLLENLARKDLSDIEIAHILKYMLEKHKEEYPTHEDLARAFGRDRTWVTNHLRMLQLEMDEKFVQNVSRETLERLTERQAREILSAPREKRVEVAEWIAEKYEETSGIPSAREIREYVQGLIKPEAAMEAEAQPVAVIPSKLEKPEDYVKAAEELKSPEEKFREKAGEVEEMIKKLKNMHRDVRYYEDRYDTIRYWAEESPEDALKSLEDLAGEVRGEIEEAEREEMERRLEDRVAKRMFANPKMWRKRARDLYYEELKEKFEVFRDRLVPKKAVKAIVDIYMDVGDDLTLRWVIEDLEKEVKRRREDPRYVKHGKKLNSSDVRKILEKRRMVQPSRPTILDDPDREKALEAYPFALVEFVWRLVPWKQHRLRVLKRLIRIMAAEYAVDGEIYRLLALAIEKTVPKMTWYSTGIPDKIRKLKETGKPEEFMYVRP